jgi:hypothetical protein
VFLVRRPEVCCRHHRSALSAAGVDTKRVTTSSADRPTNNREQQEGDRDRQPVRRRARSRGVVRFTPTELAAMIPKPRINVLRYHGEFEWWT